MIVAAPMLVAGPMIVAAPMIVAGPMIVAAAVGCIAAHQPCLDMARQIPTLTFPRPLLLQKGNTPLHLAAWEGHLEVVGALLAAGAALDIQNEVGQRCSTSLPVPSPPPCSASRGMLHCVMRG